MKQYVRLYLIIIVLCAGCGRSKEVSESKNNLNIPKSDILMLSPSVQDGSILYAGWPIVLEAAIWRQLSEDTNTMPPKQITIKSKSGSWSEALKVIVRDPKGADVSWPLHLVKEDSDSLTLGTDDMAGVSWWLSPEETKGLAEGTYTISISFDNKLLTDNPAQKSDNYYLCVKKEPARPDRKTQLEKDLALGSFHILRGDTPAARAMIDKVLASDPESIGGLRLSSRLLEASGKNEEAADALDSALDIYYKKYPDACPPAGLLSERDALRTKLNTEIRKD